MRTQFAAVLAVLLCVALPTLAQVDPDRPFDAFAPLDLPAPTEARLGSGAPGPAYWQQRVDYIINATLDAETKRLSATLEATYHNHSPHALTFLWIQLEQNLFRTDSIGTRSRTGGVMRAMEEEFNGGYDIPYIRTGNQDLEFQIYDTLCRVELPAPILPGETFEFELAFAFDMPPYLRRMGAEDVSQGRIFEYAQWFPHLCNYDDVHGWNTLPYAGSGEFYTNFGNYEVNITVPRTYLVAGSGLLQNPEEVLTQTQRDRLEEAMQSRETVMIRSADEVEDPSTRPAGNGPLTWRFKGDNIRTFAWAASDAFIWDACGVEIEDLDGSTRTVLCQSLYPVEAEEWKPTAEQGGSTQYVAHSVEFYSDFLYPYPYPIMTNVNGPEGGMEYPMIIFCGGRTGRGPLGVTDHEVGHTWFPMVVNTDERRHAWMDEGFNTFIGMHSLANFRGTDLDPGRSRRQTMELARGRSQPIAVFPDRNLPGLLGRLQYRKTAMGLHLLREVVLGPERFDYAFREYVRRWAFKSPQPADFFRTMEDAAGADLAWFFRQWYLEDTVLDHAIEVVFNEPEEVEEGETPSLPTATITLKSLGEMVMPAEVIVQFDDGEVEIRNYPVEAWATTRERSFTVELDGRSLRRVVVDRDDVLPDINPGNNRWSANQ
ncbi:MAG: M1 family metallopeptidase [Phycisphaerales bacterium]|nr:M1 family metallopeptidase [Phycisphaerales bacterium]